ncbi:MAG: hypothetical protein J1F31_05865 [Erysipelotrichales bacterium]|nr:hypothetical protein [Erysipelotrichales bacterium]
MEKKKISTKELVGYIIAGLIALFGLSLMITHTVGVYLPGRNSANAVIIAENKLMNSLKIGIDFLGWGTIFLAIGVVVALIILLTVAKKVDLDYEKKQRRAQRLGKTREN